MTALIDASAMPRAARRPVLSAGLRPVWRSRTCLQLGLDPARAVVVDGVDEPVARVLLGLDGSRTESEVLAAAAEAGVDRRSLARLLAELRDRGIVRDQDGPATEAARELPRHVAGRLAPDHASLSLLGTGQDADEVLDHRRRAAIVVHGADRVGVPLAALLGAAGVGHVHVVDSGASRPADVIPGGLGAADVHRSRASGAADAIRRCSPEARTAALPPHRLPDLVVIGSTRPVESGLRAALHSAGLPHLVVGVRETTAVVGPLVLPGSTGCLRCADLHRADRDPSWPMVAAQLTGRDRRGTEPCDVALAAMAAATGALQCLALIDGGEPVTRGGALELALPDWRLRRRSWPPHRRCDCGSWTGGAGRPAPAVPAQAQGE